MWNFFRQILRCGKKDMGLWSLQAMRLGPKTENSKNSPKIQSFIIFWSEKTIGSISQKQLGSSLRKFGLLWNNLIQFVLFYNQKLPGGLTVLRSAPKHLNFLPHVKNIMTLMWNFFRQILRCGKKDMGLWSLQAMRLGPKTENSKNSPKIQFFIIFWSEKTIRSILQKQLGSFCCKFGLLWNNLIQFALFYNQKPPGGLTVL